MKRIKQIAVYSFCTLLVCVFNSCSEEKTYPRYELVTVTVIPDSLKNEHRTWITETVRAASQNMTGGDYEDVDETIIQCEETAEKLFGVKVKGLRLERSREAYFVYLKPSELNDYEKAILDSLIANAH